MIDLRPIGGTTTKKTPRIQPNLFDVPTAVTVTRPPPNIQTGPLKPLVRALLTDLIDGQRRAAADAEGKVRMKS